MKFRGIRSLAIAFTRASSTCSGSGFYAKLAQVQLQLDKLRLIQNIDRKHAEYKRLEAQALEADAWKQQQRLSELHLQLEEMRSLENTINESKELFELAQDEKDQTMKSHCSTSLEIVEDVIRQKRLNALLSGPYDNYPCFMQIIAGAGGIESRDWVSMLSKMYLAWADEHPEGIKASIIDSDNVSDHAHSSDKEGPRSLTLKFVGQYSFPYGLLKSDAGVHRLVRISPFDPQHKRHTSFAQVLIYPCFDDTSPSSSAHSKSDVIIPVGDLRVDTFKSSGAGGQHVNTTDSAVRITHIPTGIAVSCQNERSQHQNRATAMSILRARLWQLEKDRQHKAKKASTVGGDVDNSFGGSHIRSYVMQPYTLVKDHRSGWECHDVEAFLRGQELDGAILAALEVHHKAAVGSMED